MKHYIKNTIRLLFLLASLSVSAQQSVITASIEPGQILIGEQTVIRLQVATDKGTSIQLPVIPDTLMRGVEVLSISMPDTVDIGNNRIQINYNYLITSFDSALYLIPPFRLIADMDTFYSNELALKVSTVPVDTESKQFYDVKNVMNPPLVLADYIDILFYILGFLLLILLILYIVFRRKKNKPLIPFKKPEIILPPHIRAIQELDKLKAQKMWQQGKEKEFHSKISDIIRKYIEERFDIGAMEMTSKQILRRANGVSDMDSSYNYLEQILLLADLVKFAKYRSLPEENELSMMNAYLFVNDTQIEEKPTENEKKEEVEQNETK
jgi:hypothetical protein